MRDKKGVALIVAIFVIVVFSALGVVVVSLMSGGTLIALGDYNSIRAFQVADSGLRYTVAAFLAADTDWSNNTGFTANLSPGYFTVSYLYKTKKRCTLQITGVVGNISRTITVDVKKSGYPGAFDYAVCSFNYQSESLYIQNSATIYGDFWYDGPVIMQNSAKLLNGTMYSDSLELQNESYCASWEPVTPVDPVIFDSTYYDNLLAETTKGATSALNLGGTSVLNLNGQTLYYTSITISGSARVNGPGRLVATTGNFTLMNTAIISDEVMVIVKGTSTLQNDAVIRANFNLISQGSIAVQNTQNVPKEATFFSYGNISFDNIAQFWGAILAPSGEVTSVNATTFNGLIYGNTVNLQNSTKLNGSAAVSQVGYFKNLTIVTYDPAKLPSVIPEGIEGGGESSREGLSITNWSENF